MKRLLTILLLITLLFGCGPAQRPETIAQLRSVEIPIEKEQEVVGLDKAIESYERFLEETTGTPMAAEAIRRLADLKVEKGYGLIDEAPGGDVAAAEPVAPGDGERPELAVASPESPPSIESAASMQRRATAFRTRAGGDPARSGNLEAIALYRKLLDEYPDYERNDQVLYQLSRAYEDLGRVDEAMTVMDRLVTEFPGSRYFAEVQFRRAEYFFIRHRYIDAEDAYGSIIAIGEKTNFYIQALYKLGWTFYKQELYQDALHNYMALLDYRGANGYDFGNIRDDLEKKRIEDTLRVISLSFSYLGGPDAVDGYFAQYGRRTYEDLVYSNLAEYYFSKRRYSDAVTTYDTFVERNPSHRQAPLFVLRVIEINQAGGFPSLVIASKKDYVSRYAFGSDYWRSFDPDNRSDVTDGLKTNLIDLANHYHALYRDKTLAEEKRANYEEALNWYREFLDSFPKDIVTPAINYQLAELLLENDSFAEAALEYEKTAYAYPLHDKSDQAGYAAVFASRQHLADIEGDEKAPVRRDVIRVSLAFAEHFPGHEKAAVVMGAAVDDLYALHDFTEAEAAARSLIELFPHASADVRRSAWLVAAHSLYELGAYRKAETAYLKVLELLPEADASRADLVDNLAASIYKQGEAANLSRNYKMAAEHFLRVAVAAPSSKIRPIAEFDGAAALIMVEEWQGAVNVLNSFRRNFPNHELQHDVTRKLAYVYREDGNFALAAEEFERIESESDDPLVRQDALITAAELYEKIDDIDHAVSVYRRYVDAFPEPVDVNLELRDKLAAFYGRLGRQNQYHDELRQIVLVEAAAGEAQTNRTRFIAASAALVLADLDFEDFVSVRLVRPFKENLQRKRELMKKVTDVYAKLYDYEVGIITAASTFHLAEVYADFSSALTKSERPDGLSALEREQYELALEEQAWPFEEKAIEMHQRNLELIASGVYNDWIEKSLAKLAVFMPARYAKTEVNNDRFATPDGFRFENETLFRIARAEAARAAETEAATPKAENDTDRGEPPLVAPETVDVPPIGKQAVERTGGTK